MLASTCLPLLHHAIELDGEPYWDGGYAANPPLVPLVRASEGRRKSSSSRLRRRRPNGCRCSPREIATRIEQIQFNANLNSELEALKAGKMIGVTEKLRRLRIGRISAAEEFEGLAGESAGNVGREFLERLHNAGRAAADLWLKHGLPAAAGSRD